MAELDDAVGAELPVLEIFQARWNNYRSLSRLYDGAESHEGNACLEREQVGLVVRAALGEHRNRAASAEHFNAMLKHNRLVNLRQYLVLIFDVWIVDLGAWAFELQLCVTDDLLDDLLFDGWLVLWTDESNRVARLEMLREHRLNTLDRDLILKLYLALAGFGEVLRALHRHRLRPAEEGAENGPPK